MAEANNPKRQRQKELRRAKIEQQIREHRARRRRRLTVLAGLLALVLAALVLARVWDPTDDPTEAAEDSDETSTETSAQAPQDLEAPDMTIDPSTTYAATVSTSMGDIVIELDPQMSPNTVNSFVSLARMDYYEGLVFHRIVKDFALQGGSPAGDGMGGPGYSVQDDVPQDFRYTRGVVAMAKTGADPAGTSGSQFFIVPADSAAERFTPDYAVLGRVVDGMDVVDAMNNVAVEGETPVETITIEGIEISES
ncbi:MAG: peptidylprolyl isomerase [Actinomycetota bacterium]